MSSRFVEANKNTVVVRVFRGLQVGIAIVKRAVRVQEDAHAVARMAVTLAEARFPTRGLLAATAYLSSPLDSRRQRKFALIVQAHKFANDIQKLAANDINDSQKTQLASLVKALQVGGDAIGPSCLVEH